MTDCFALMGEPRRPWLDSDALKERFVARSADVHPDRYHGASAAEREEAVRRYTDLNTAYQTLRETRSRLLHLLELETGGKPKDIQRIPPGTMDLFVGVGQACREVDDFLAERARVTSPMLKVKCFSRGLEMARSLQEWQGRVAAATAEVEGELARLNEAWGSAPEVGSEGRASALPLERLEELYRISSYIVRWTQQLQERLVPLVSG